MGFDEVQFPTTISYGSSGGPGFSTAIIETDSGAEERVSRWTSARRRYNVAYGIKSKDDLHTLIKFYIARRGAASGFRYKDWLDFTSAANGQDAIDDEDQVIGTGDASETQFQLIKKYTSGAVTRTRNITKPITVSIALDGAPQGAGWSVNTATGIVTFAAAPGNGVEITAGFTFDVPVRFGRVVDDLLDLNIEAFDIGSVPSIELVEIRDETVLDEEFYYGGGQDMAISSNTQLAIADGRVLNITPSAAGKEVYLPATTGLVAGGPYFYIRNGSAADTFALKTVGGAAGVIVVGTETTVTVILILFNAVLVWVAF